MNDIKSLQEELTSMNYDSLAALFDPYIPPR